MQAAHAAVKVKDSHLAAVYHMLKNREPYRERGMAPPSECARRKLADRLQRRIEKLGYRVTLTHSEAQPV